MKIVVLFCFVLSFKYTFTITYTGLELMQWHTLTLNFTFLNLQKEMDIPGLFQ